MCGGWSLVLLVAFRLVEGLNVVSRRWHRRSLASWRTPVARPGIGLWLGVVLILVGKPLLEGAGWRG